MFLVTFGGYKTRQLVSNSTDDIFAPVFEVPDKQRTLHNCENTLFLWLILLQVQINMDRMRGSRFDREERVGVFIDVEVSWACSLKSPCCSSFRQSLVVRLVSCWAQSNNFIDLSWKDQSVMNSSAILVCSSLWIGEGLRNARLPSALFFSNRNVSHLGSSFLFLSLYLVSLVFCFPTRRTY